MKVVLTTKRIADFCPAAGGQQVFLWDEVMSGLAVRKTGAGSVSFIYQSRFRGRTLRMTIGKVSDWSIKEARVKAREIQRHIDVGDDPREVMEEKLRVQTERRRSKKLSSLTFSHVWGQWVSRMETDWSANTLRDSQKAIQKGGQPRKRWAGKVTKPGPLAAIADVKVSDLNLDLLVRVASLECKKRPTQFRLALRMMRACLNWASEELKLDIPKDISSSRRLQRIVGKPAAKTDYLNKDQLKTWFAHVRAPENNKVSRAYLQCLLLTGARRSELLMLRWADVDVQWSQLSLADKIDGTRKIPLTPYVRTLLGGLPKHNEWVFFSSQSISGHIVDPSIAHRKYCKDAGLAVSLHGLRRSFKSLSEWLDIPVGVIAQIMGHKPSATVEKHYTVRPVDLLRVHHTRLESWMLKQAGLDIDEPQASYLSVVS